MNTRSANFSLPNLAARFRRRLAPCAVAFLVTMYALPASAVTIPNTPLQSGASFPSPNIRFILDDSGSMTGDGMPDSVPSVSPVDISDLAYTRNTLSYNPATTYKPWIKFDGSRYTAGMVYTSAFSDNNLLSTSTNLSSSTKTFYVPKVGAVDMAATGSYWRYDINSGGGSITRSEYGTVVAPTISFAGFPKSGQTANSGTFVFTYTVTVPVGATSIDFATSGGTKSGSGVDLYVRRNAAPTTSLYDCRSQGNNNNESCSINNPTAGDIYYVSLYRNGNFTNVTLTGTYDTTNRCSFGGNGSSDWINCTNTLPSARTLADELINYATWYSYHRTRMKIAKAGASEAFSQIGTNLRVGFDTIWNRSAFNIPVGTDNGLFRDFGGSTNRSTWYARLVAAQGSSTTPLKPALQRAGNYYSGTTATGPWGPEVGAAQISCRQSFSILTTDGYWNDNTGFTSVGDADSTALNADNPLNTAPDGTTYRYAPINPFKDNVSPTRSDTLADVAMYYWKRDLVSTLVNDVPTSAADPAFWQHMVTFGVSIGQHGNLNPATDLPGIINGSVKWTNPLDAEDDDRIDDLWHAAVNGHGSFVAATNAQEFAQALSDALALIAARRGSASNVSTNSTSFQSDTRVFQARYWSGRWTGELAAYPATSAGVALEPAWQASQLIPAQGSRNIRTYNGIGGTTFPTAAQTTALDKSARPLTPISGANNALYIRGSATLEKRNGGLMRNREISVREAGVDVIRPTALGDIVNSTPIFVQQLQTIFVGGNDGMLHAFNATTGVERFAYVPAGIDIDALAGLSDPNYVHSYFVDGPIAVSNTAQTPSHNYLVGALGRGGKGVFGLDVTTPDSFNNSNVLWERTTGTNMGYVLGEPLVVKLNDGSSGVLVSNGINSTSGHSVLFILDIATGAIIREIDTGVVSGGLSAPRAWDNDGNGTVDYVYAGDMSGNVWKFDLTAASTASWAVAFSGQPLMTARDASNNLQPITAGLALAREPVSGRRWIFVGTGKFMEQTDVGSVRTQSMYGLIDDDSSVITGRTSGGDGQLQARAFVLAGTVAGKPVRSFETQATLPAGKRGWYLDLLLPPTPTQEGERIVSNPRVFGTVLVTASLIPPLNNTCDAGGRGYVNALDAFTGTSLLVPFFNVNGNSSGGNPIFTDDVLVNGAQSYPIGSVDLGVGMPTLPTIIDKLLVVGGSTGTIAGVETNPTGSGSRRVSWREIESN